MTTRVYVPRDAAALALGADAVASLLRQAGDVEVVRTGSRGLFWLEPMVEVATAEGRIAYGPVTVADISGLLDAGMLTGGAHQLRLGRPEELPFLAKQTRLTFARCGIVDPLSLDDYRAHGGLKGIARAQRDRSGRDDRDGDAIGTARPWRRGVPDRHQVEDRRRCEGRAQVHRLQCGRGRFRHVRRSDADGRRSVRADRGHGDRRLRGRRHQGLRLHALGVPARDRHVQRGPRCRAARRTCSARASTSSSGSAPAPMSAARRPRCSTAWRASAARCASSRRCRRTRACSACPRSSTTSCRWPACRSSWTRAPSIIARSAWGARAARCRSSLPATSNSAACSSAASA